MLPVFQQYHNAFCWLFSSSVTLVKSVLATHFRCDSKMVCVCWVACFRLPLQGHGYVLCMGPVCWGESNFNLLSWPGSGFQHGPLADRRQQLVQGFEGLESEILFRQEIVQAALCDSLEGVVQGPQKDLEALKLKLPYERFGRHTEEPT